MANDPTAAQHVRELAATALPVSLLAGPVAVLWAHVVPHAGLVIDKFGDYVPAGGTGEFIRGEGWFLVMTLIVGGLTGLVAWWLTRGRSPGAVVGLAAGGTFAGFAVARIGQQRNTTQLHLAARAHEFGLSGPLVGHYPPLGHGVAFGWAFGAVFVYALLAVLVVRR